MTQAQQNILEQFIQEFTLAAIPKASLKVGDIFIDLGMVIPRMRVVTATGCEQGSGPNPTIYMLAYEGEPSIDRFTSPQAMVVKLGFRPAA
jgi:hypothetical protein